MAPWFSPVSHGATLFGREGVTNNTEQVNTVRQCWAYNTSGQRCQKTPNHRGLHEIRQTWDDTQCLTPDAQVPQTRELRALPIDIPIPAPATADEQSKCVACKHRHRGGECQCGCHEHIG